MKRLTLILTILALPLVTACSGEESHAATTETDATAAKAPALPPELQKIAEATTNIQAAEAETERETAHTFAATGEFVSPVRSEVAPKMPGHVAKVLVDEGALVHQGQAVLLLDTDYIRLNLQGAEAEAARAKAARDDASRDLDRKKDLIAKNSIPPATFDRTQSAFDQANAAYDAAVARVALLRQQLADATMRSPVDGVIAEKRTEVGDHLGDAGIAFVIVQISPIRLRFQVPERYLGRIGPGDPVTAHVDPYPNQAFEGTIKTVGGVIDPKTRTMFAEAEFANRDHRLRPGLFARVETKLD